MNYKAWFPFGRKCRKHIKLTDVSLSVSIPSNHPIQICSRYKKGSRQ